MLRDGQALQPLRVLVAASVVVPALLFGLLAVLSWSGAVADAEREVAWTAEVGREHAAKVFDSFRLVAERVDDALEAEPRRPDGGSRAELVDRFRGFIADLPQIESFIVVDRGGRLIAATASRQPLGDIDFSGRDYFQALRSESRPAYISQVQTSLISGKAFFGWGKARHASDGSFDGVIDIAIAPGFFMLFYETLVRKAGNDLDGRVVTMIRDDGQILVRYPGFAGSPARVPSDNPFFAAVSSSPDGGSYRNRSVVDAGGPERLFAFRKVPGHPVYIVSGRSLDAVAGEWRLGMLRYLAVGAPSSLVLFLFAMSAFRGARREQEALVQVRSEMALREKAEDALRQAHKMEAVGQLTGGVAHDFNNLLAAIGGCLDLLQSRLNQGRLGEIGRYVTTAQAAVKRGASLTHRLLAFSRRQTLDPKATDVGRLVRELEDLVRRAVGPSLAVDVLADTGSWTAMVDANQLENVLLNLCINARDAMPDGGRLTITVSDAVLNPADAAPAEMAPGEYVCLCVSDTGTGMAPEVLERVFEPFFTTKPMGQGTGLGLSMAFGFVRQSGGQVRIRSEPGRGTDVRLYFPRHHGAEDAPEGSQGSRAEPLREARGMVLVVDDEAPIRALIAEVLEERGFTVLKASDGPTGLAALQAEAAIDVLVSDVGLPGGMNGRQLADAGRSLRPALRVLLITGYAETAALRDGKLPPGMHLVTKPFSMEVLAARVGELVRQVGGGGEDGGGPPGGLEASEAGSVESPQAL